MMDKTYFEYRIRKRNGKVRIIKEPNPELKAVQHEILRSLSSIVEIPLMVNGFVRNRSILTNAEPHLKSKYILSIDISDFFPSITEDMIQLALRRAGISDHEVVRIADICTLEGRLPQGAPTSPILSNIVFRPLDDQITEYCNTKGLIYTRYADDVTISGEYVDAKEILPFLDNLLRMNGFRMNYDKTKLYGKNVCARVTGITVVSKPNAPRKLINKVRGNLHKLKVSIENGELTDKAQVTDIIGVSLDTLSGWVSFIYSVDPKTPYKEKLRNIVQTLHNS
jgi:RNA-directed DNA polymerase